ncbi:MAG: MFS transporter [Proteobacteria bacterium]|nr:MFS transporter [Pseudomonadota bacterium]
MAEARRRFSYTELVLFGLIFALSVGEGGARFLSPVYLEGQGAAIGSIGLALSGFGAAALAARFLIGSTFQASAIRLTIAISAAASAASLYLITTTSSILAFSVLIAIHGLGWGVLATVLLTLIIAGKEKGSAAVIIGFYVGVEGLGRTGSPILAGILGGAYGPSTGMRIHTALFVVTAIAGIALLRDARPAETEDPDRATRPRIDLARFRHVPLAAWVAALTGFYLNTTNAVLNTFFPLLGLTLGFSLGQIGWLAGARSAVAALIRFVAHKAFDVIPFRILFVPLYVINAASASLIGAIAVYPVQFFLWVPNGASRGVLRVGSMAKAMEDSDDQSASATAALIGAGYDVGRIVGPATGGLVAAAVGLDTMFVAMPLFFLAVILPMALATQRRSHA